MASHGGDAAQKPSPTSGGDLRGLRGIFIVMALALSVLIEGFRPDRWGILGASVALLGALIMVAAPRG